MRVAVRHPQRPDARRRRAAAEVRSSDNGAWWVLFLRAPFFTSRIGSRLFAYFVHCRASFRVRPMDGAWFALSSRARSPRSREPRVDGMWRRFLSTGHTTIYLPASQLTYTYTYIPQYIYKSYIPVAYCRYSRATSVASCELGNTNAVGIYLLYSRIGIPIKVYCLGIYVRYYTIDR